MAIWKEQGPARKDPTTPDNPTLVNAASPPPSPDTATRARGNGPMESVIAGDLAIEGKIEGAGHVRLVGTFKGDVQVDGNLTIEKGAKVTGTVRAGTVIIGGELEGNVEASRVELLDTGMLNGDLKSGTLTVIAGSRMRGQVEFGWQEKDRREPRMKLEASSVS